MVCFLAAAFVACEEDRVVLDVDGGPTEYLFPESGSDLPVAEEGVSTAIVEVAVTTTSGSDRTIPVSIDPASTALASEYSIDASSLVIPAGSLVGQIKITGNFDALPNGVTRQLIFTLNEDEVTIMDDRSFHILNIFRACPTDIAGSYSVTTTYGFHDFLPNFSSYTMTTEITVPPAAADNTYAVADFSGGLYSVGPYASAYGTGSAGQAGNRDLIFQVNCGTITWSGQSDPWGSIIPTPGGVNTYNEDTGVLTISWTATGYGENGVSVYTPN